MLSICPQFCLPHFFLPLYPKRELINMEPHLACSLLRLFRQRKPNLNFGKLKIPTDLSGKYLNLTSNFSFYTVLARHTLLLHVYSLSVLTSKLFCLQGSSYNRTTTKGKRSTYSFPFFYVIKVYFFLLFTLSLSCSLY